MGHDFVSRVGGLIDLHCHILPGIDDGAPDLETALEMARIAVADGIVVTACTPHMMPGVYDNQGPDVRLRISALQAALDEHGISLRLVTGADVHLQESLGARLNDGRLLSLNDSRYFLFEPPHYAAPPRLPEAVFDVMSAGYHPVLTHPERLSWIETHYEVIKTLAERGVWMQVTAGSLTGRFGRRPQYWAERMVAEGHVHILATDAHNLRGRTPILSEARDIIAQRLGEDEAENMVLNRPLCILENLHPAETPPRPAIAAKPARNGWFANLFGRPNAHVPAP